MDYQFAGERHERFKKRVPEAIQYAKNRREMGSVDEDEAIRDGAWEAATLEIEHGTVFEDDEQDALECVLEQAIREHFENERDA